MAASPACEQLIALLVQWTRGAISQTLFSFPDPYSALVSGAVLECVQACHKPREASVKLPVATSAICVFDEAYPPALAHIPDPPLVLFYQGDLRCLTRRGVAIVGARRATRLGRETAEHLAGGLARFDLAIISGLAYGIDGAAHAGALGVQGATIAVLGGGLGEIYPQIHHGLARRILAQDGLLLSEYEHHRPPLAHQFPERNRIISGLSEGVVVVEAGLKSGSLITARLALEQGREVFVVPGPVSSLVSQGCHRLIRQGAELVTDAAQIAQTLNVARPATDQEEKTAQSAHVLTTEQRYLLSFMEREAMSLDELIALTGWSTVKLTRALTELDLAGIVQVHADGYIASSNLSE